ncbi:MAG: sigma-70 family RNA polymerase sigma factor [Opitutaceae bacterium]
MQSTGAPSERHRSAPVGLESPNENVTTEQRAGRDGARFPTTQWSMIVTVANRGPDARSALEKLCRIYWFPLYTYVRRRGNDHAAAEDLTQEFFRLLLDSDRLGRATPERGRFRGYLVANMRSFLAHDWEKSRARKRGGDFTFFALDAQRADERFQNEPIDPGLTPEQAFDRAWALQMMDRVLGAIGAEFASKGREDFFLRLRTLVWGDSDGASHESIAAEFGMTAGAVRIAVHRLRQKVREQLRVEVGATLVDAEETESELNYLLGALRVTTLPQM